MQTKRQKAFVYYINTCTRQPRFVPDAGILTILANGR